MGNTKDALEEYEACLALIPNDVEACISIGDLLYRNREYSSAANYYRKAAKLDPDYWRRVQDANSADGKAHPARDTLLENYRLHPVGDFGPDPAPSGSKEQPWKAK